MIGPTPRMSVMEVPEAATARAGSGVAPPRVEALQIGDHFAGKVEFRLCDNGLRRDAVEDGDRVCDRQLRGEAAGDQLTEHGVQPAQQLGPQPAQIVVAA